MRIRPTMRRSVCRRHAEPLFPISIKNGITAVEAGAYLTDLIQKILDKKASGVELQN